uniref:Phenazine biosynthesis-like domain-containing protein n=1 Tax=Rhizochromulina marina TaxID=1034831 RepID=A0A7S2RF46_9STRA|mmetsp:Transcript_15328/g.45401  ORF Transcript_15328/g.45401 Transcript_15328/m.45401 type:complete len:308 (+) Transcript_15328:30-953(+)
MRSVGRGLARVPFFQVDSFAGSPLEGNPAAVLLLPPDLRLPDALLCRIAAENNLSETAFVQPLDASPGAAFSAGPAFGLRWFTPIREVKLCGHGTLAAAAAVFAVGNPHSTLRFQTLSGELSSSLKDGAIALDFPVNPGSPCSAATLPDLDSIVAAVLYESDLQVEDVVYSQATSKLVVRVAGSGEAPLRRLRPASSQLLDAHDGSQVTGVSVTSAGEGAYDFFSRYFAPWNGIPEDPVNGSSHTILAPYWSQLLGNRPQLRARQASPRGGDLDLELLPDANRVNISGPASIVIEGTMLIPANEDEA